MSRCIHLDLRENKNAYLLKFSAGGESYQIPVAEVERVLSLQRQALSPIPFGLGGSVEGLFSFRGAALPLVRLSGAPSSTDGDGKDITVILLGEGAKRFGIAADGASAVSDAPDPNAVFVRAQELYERGVAGV